MRNIYRILPVPWMVQIRYPSGDGECAKYAGNSHFDANMRQRQKGDDVNRINVTQILPVAMILLDVGAAIVCARRFGQAGRGVAR